MKNQLITVNPNFFMLKYIKNGQYRGSTNSNLYNFPKNKFETYILGLWCADGYSRSSSVGISNIDVDLIKLLKSFLKVIFLKKDCVL